MAKSKHSRHASVAVRPRWTQQAPLGRRWWRRRRWLMCPLKDEWPVICATSISARFNRSAIDRQAAFVYYIVASCRCHPSTSLSFASVNFDTVVVVVVVVAEADRCFRCWSSTIFRVLSLSVYGTMLLTYGSLCNCCFCGCGCATKTIVVGLLCSSKFLRQRTLSLSIGATTLLFAQSISANYCMVQF